MNVRAYFVKTGFRVTFLFLAALFLALTRVVAVASTHNDIPGKRHGIELEASRTFSSQFIRDLQSPDRGRAMRAALALGRIKDKRALFPLILRFEEGSDPGVRAMAIYGVGLLAVSMRVPVSPIIAALRDRAAVVRAAGVDAAQRAISARRADASLLLAPLVVCMRADGDAIVRGRAAVALAAFAVAARALPGASASPAPQTATAGAAVAEAFASEPDPTVRWHEAWALGRAFPMAPADAEVRAGLHDRDELVRMAFIDVVARRRDPRLAGLIEPLRADPSWRVAEQAREGLRRLAGGSRTEHLRAIPAGVATPRPDAPDTAPALRRPAHLGAPQRPTAADADLRIALQITGAASLDGPAPGLHPRVRIGTTKGAIIVRLYPEWAPLTVANFLNLTNRGYYDGLRWFRIVPNFVVQTGDKTNTGDGDAGYLIPAEENPLEQRSGIISMGLNYRGNMPIRDSAGTQFYLTLSPQFHLNGAFTVFGEIERGFDVLGRLVESDRMTRVEELPPVSRRYRHSR
jgi:peptidyl-prolyl cis-trans isomerase B (cyclophilin B)